MAKDLEKINNTTFRQPVNDDWRDFLEVEIGDAKQAEFYPQIKIKRWDNEVNFSVCLKDEIGGNVVVDGNKITWSKGNIDIEYYPYTEGEGGMKMIPYLKAKPTTNQIRFSVKRKGLDFFRQPPLTEEYQNGYSEEFEKEIVVTETQVKDLNGNVLVHRPPEVVNSFAIYHKTKGGMNSIYGKDYKVGKFGQDFRPKLIDKNGLEAWAEIDYIWFDEENGERIITIPQSFLDNAVFPIRSNDTFGYTTVGGTWNTSNGENLAYFNKATPASTGTVDKITSYVKSSFGSGKFIKGVIWSTDEIGQVGSVIANGVAGISPSFGTSPAWLDMTYSTSPDITSGNYYFVGHIGDDSNVTTAYDTVSGIGSDLHGQDPNNYTTPEGWAFVTNATRKHSSYATYTPESSSSSSSSFSSSSSSCSLDSTKSYSRGDYLNLPIDDSDLETPFICIEYPRVDLDDDIYVRQCARDALDPYGIFVWKDKHDNNTDAIVSTCILKASRAPSINTVYLQIYNRNSNAWETLDSDNVTAVDTEFTLSGVQSTDLSYYYDVNYWIVHRIYQKVE